MRLDDEIYFSEFSIKITLDEKLLFNLLGVIKPWLKFLKSLSGGCKSSKVFLNFLKTNLRQMFRTLRTFVNAI